MKLKRMPSLRDKKRYITFRLHSEKPVSYSEMKDAVLGSIAGWLGENGLSAASPRIIRNLWNEKRQEGWLSVSHRAVDGVMMSLALVRQIGEMRATFQVLRVSGTIKSGKSKMPK